MADKQIKTIRWEDGRHAERHVVDWHPAEDGTEQRIEELYVEPERQMNLRKKVIEKRKPVVVHRTTQTIEGDQIVDQVVEDREQDRLQLVQHIGLAKPQSFAPEDDLAGQVKELVGVLKAQQQTPAVAQVAQSRRISRSEVGDTPPLQPVVENRMMSDKTLVIVNGALSLVIVAILTAIGYIAWFG